MKAHEDFLPWTVLEARLADLQGVLEQGDVTALRRLVEELVPGFQPDEAIFDWVHCAQVSAR